MLFDIRNYTLGTLCRRKHEYQNTGKSVRYINGGCLECIKNNDTPKQRLIKSAKAKSDLEQAEKTFEYNKSIHILGKPCKKEGHTIPGFYVSLRYIKHGTVKNICVGCSNECINKHKKANRETILPKRREAYKKPEHLAVRQAYLPVYRERACVIAATRRSRKREACPSWVDIEAIRSFYAHSALMSKVTGVKHNVDHIEPLINDLVCGLHVPANLRITTQFANYSKNNRFTPFVLSDCNEP